MNKVFWMRPDDTKLGAWQKQIAELSGSKSFCVLPWIHLATRPNGDMRICCVANASGAKSGNYDVGLVKLEDKKIVNFANNKPSEVFNSDFMKTVRKTMLDEKVPYSCYKCFEEEEQGIVSKRIWETGTWVKQGTNINELITNTNEDGSVPYKIKYLDLRLGHTCNLKCVMCSPHDSSQWVSDHKKIYPTLKSDIIRKQMYWERKGFNNFWYENKIFWDEIYDQIENLKHLYFAGGEPLMIKEHKIFLEEIIKRGFSKNIELRYNSNALLLDNEIIDIWKNFKFTKFSVSIDGMNEKLRYIRYPTDWNIVETNLWKLENAAENIFPTIACTAQLLNIKHIPDLIKWKVNSKFKKLNLLNNEAGQITGGGLIGIHLVWIPTWLSLRVLPKDDKEEVRLIFNNLKEWLWNNYTQDDEFWKYNPYGWKRWVGILDWMDQEDHTHLLPDFREYITKLDKIRGTSFRETFRELAHLL